MRFAVPAIAVTIALATFFAACGGGDSPFDSVQPTPTVASASQTPFPEDTATPAPSGCIPTDYTVAEGDTLLAIATTYGVTVDDIVAASELDDPDFLSIGQVLKIPCPDNSTPTPTSEPIGTGSP